MKLAITLGALFALHACGAPAAENTAPAVPTAATAAPVTEAPTAEATATPAAAATEAPAPAHESEPEALARELLKGGGRRIGWSAQKKSFVYPSRRRSGSSVSLNLLFTDENGVTKDTLQVCQADECDEHMGDKAKEVTPKLVSRLDSEGFVAVRAIGWPSGRDELDVGSLRLKLRNTGGKLEALREGKPAARIGNVKPPVILAVYVAPEGKRIGVTTAPSADAQETEQSFAAFALP